jgi:hypothetical protein
MTMEYIRRNYHVPAKRGGRVIALNLRGKKTQHKGVITSATHYVYVRLDGEKHSKPYHPDSLYYCEEEGE